MCIWDTFPRLHPTQNKNGDCLVHMNRLSKELAYAIGFTFGWGTAS